MSELFKPCKLTRFELAHKLVYAPLTRCRADGKGVQPKEAATYYAQRASAGGLIISEATNICPGAQGYPNTPGIWTEAQVEAWKPVTSAVKEATSKTAAAKEAAAPTPPPATFFCQLWATGRVSASAYQPDGRPPPSASATRFEGAGGVTLPDFSSVPYETARALEAGEIEELVGHYGRAARNAVSKAGFDGVEVHLANGYLPEQFLRRSTNKRGDAYGADTFENRARFALEIVRAAAEGAGGADRVGVRLSPFGQFLMGGVDDDAADFYAYLVRELAKVGIAYVHVIEPRMTEGNKEAESWDRSWSLEPLRQAWHAAVVEEEVEEEEVAAGGKKEQQNGNASSSSLSSSSSSKNATATTNTSRRFIAAGGFNRKRALEHAERFPDDLVAFGRFWLSTPDLPARLEADEPLNQYHRDSFYIPDTVRGYTDYPTLAEVEAQADKYEVKEHYDGSKIFVLKK